MGSEMCIRDSIGYDLVSGETAIAGKGDDLLKNPDVGRLFLGG